MPAHGMLRLPTWWPTLGPLVWMDLRRRYAGSVMGASWAVLAPVLEAAAYAVVFGSILGAATRGPLPYAVLIATGVFPWTALREALEGGARVLPENRWIRRSRVPVELMVARLALTSSLRVVAGLAVVFVFAAATGRSPGVIGWIAPLLALALQLVGTYGLALLVAPSAALLPDLRPGLVSLLTLLTFASPILYPESMAHGLGRTLLLCNPFTHLLRLYRSPAAPLAAREFLLSASVGLVAALAALVVGWWGRARLWWTARDLL